MHSDLGRNDKKNVCACVFSFCVCVRVCVCVCESACAVSLSDLLSKLACWDDARNFAVRMRATRVYVGEDICI